MLRDGEPGVRHSSDAPRKHHETVGIRLSEYISPIPAAQQNIIDIAARRGTYFTAPNAASPAQRVAAADGSEKQWTTRVAHATDHPWNRNA